MTADSAALRPLAVGLRSGEPPGHRLQVLGRRRWYDGDRVWVDGEELEADGQPVRRLAVLVSAEAMRTA